MTNKQKPFYSEFEVRELRQKLQTKLGDDYFSVLGDFMEKRLGRLEKAEQKFVGETLGINKPIVLAGDLYVACMEKHGEKETHYVIERFLKNALKLEKGEPLILMMGPRINYLNKLIGPRNLDRFAVDIIEEKIKQEEERRKPKSHPHAELMAQYAIDAVTNPEPWLLWQHGTPRIGEWKDCVRHPSWNLNNKFRRKP